MTYHHQPDKTSLVIADQKATEHEGTPPGNMLFKYASSQMQTLVLVVMYMIKIFSLGLMQKRGLLFQVLLLRGWRQLHWKIPSMKHCFLLSLSLP